MKKLYSLLIVTLVFFILTQSGSAQMDDMDHMDHMTQKDGDVIGELSLHPEMPKAQQEVTLMFSINDQSRAFRIDACDCNVTIVASGKLPYSQKITTPSSTTNGLYSVMVPFTFPRGGDYTITFSGTPTSSHTFTSFTLPWHVTVAPSVNEIQTLKTPKHEGQMKSILIILFLAMLLGVGLVLSKNKLFKK